MDTDKESFVCPESTIESANRRNFIRKAAAVTAASAVGATLLAGAARGVIPESSASSAATDFCCVAVKKELVVCKGPVVFGSCVTLAVNRASVSGGRFIVKTCGKVGIGNDTPTNMLCVGGTIAGTSATYCGVVGCSSACCYAGIQGHGKSVGVKGTAACGTGVFGCSSNGNGVEGYSAHGTGVEGTSVTNYGVHGSSSGCPPFAGVYGCSSNKRGYGVKGFNNCGNAIWGNSNSTCRGYAGVYGVSGLGGSGVIGAANPPGAGVSGYVLAACTPCGIGVCGFAWCGTGVKATAGWKCKGVGIFATGEQLAVHQSTPATPVGVLAIACKGVGVCVYSATGKGVCSGSCSGVGVLGQSEAGIGVEALANSSTAIPLVAQGASCQSAPLQEWRNNVCTALSVVNKCGWIGIGTATPGTTLQVNGSVAANLVSTSKSAYTMKSTCYAVLANAASSTVTLPKAKTAKGMIVFVKNVSSGTVTVKGNGSDSIDGNPSYPLTSQYYGVQLISNGSNEWFVIGTTTT